MDWRGTCMATQCSAKPVCCHSARHAANSCCQLMLPTHAANSCCQLTTLPTYRTANSFDGLAGNEEEVGRHLHAHRHRHLPPQHTPAGTLPPTVTHATATAAAAAAATTAAAPRSAGDAESSHSGTHTSTAAAAAEAEARAVPLHLLAAAGVAGDNSRLVRPG
ncbi:unnamed protein product [Closterium sp. NIES-54]